MKKPKVVVRSILALICFALTFWVHWLFILGVALLIYLNQRELMKK